MKFKWRTIESAPKDWPVLIWLPEHEHMPASAHRAILTRLGWFLAEWHNMREIGSVIQPTHWMPLPDPPKDLA